MRSEPQPLSLDFDPFPEGCEREGRVKGKGEDENKRSGSGIPGCMRNVRSYRVLIVGAVDNKSS
jgi:hypothetical protein